MLVTLSVDTTSVTIRLVTWSTKLTHVISVSRMDLTVPLLTEHMIYGHRSMMLEKWRIRRDWRRERDKGGSRWERREREKEGREGREGEGRGGRVGEREREREGREGRKEKRREI